MAFSLTGIDPLDPRPGIYREIRFAQGTSSGRARARDAVILCSKTSSGTATLDKIYGPIADREDAIAAMGYNSEALLAYDNFTKVNQNAGLYLAPATAAGSAATRAFTFAGSATDNTSLKITSLGEVVEVSAAKGDSPTNIADAVVVAVNAQKHWPFTAAGGSSIVTLTAATNGVRFDHYLTYTRMAFTKSAGASVSAASVSSGATDDNQTSLLTELASQEIYYQVNPKTATGTISTGDNGLGDHSAQITSEALPAVGKDQVLIWGCVGTNTNAVSAAVSINNPLAFSVWAENNDWSPLMLATRYAAVKALAEAVHPGANLTDYGLGIGELLGIPAPYAPTDRATNTEVKVALNNGVTPIGFSKSGTSFIIRDITTYSVLGTSKDYRAREGHIPSVMAYFSQVVLDAYRQAAQPFVADDPARGEKPLRNTTYPRDVKSLIQKSIDEMINFGGGPILDPSFRQEMKDSVEVERLTDGISARVRPVATKHNNKCHVLLEQSDAAY